MKTHFIDLHVHTIYSQEKKANLSIKETLDFYQAQGQYHNGKVIIRINDHNTIFGGVDAVEYFLAHRSDYPNLFVIPGIEFSTNMGHALKIEDPNFVPDVDYPDSDAKYSFVFKKGHVGAAPILDSVDSLKRWKENKDLIAYSKLSKMFLNASENCGRYQFKDSIKPYDEFDMIKLSNVGDQVISSKNIIRKKFGVIIPYSSLIPCTEEGLNVDEILCRFLEISSKYLKEHYQPFANLELIEVCSRIKRAISGFYQNINHRSIVENFLMSFAPSMNIDIAFVEELINNPFMPVYSKLTNIIDHYNSTTENSEQKQVLVELMRKKAQTLNIFSNFYVDTRGNRKINIDELCNIVYQAGGIIDFEHPNKGLVLHEKSFLKPHSTEIDHIEYAQIPTSLLRDIDFSTIPSKFKYELLDLIRAQSTISIHDVLKHDKTGLVAVQIIKKSLDKQGIKFNKNYIGVEIPKFAVEMAHGTMEKVLDVMDRKHFLPNVGFDKHMNLLDYNYLLLKDKNKELLDKDGMFKDMKSFNQYIKNLETRRGKPLMEVENPDFYNDFSIRSSQGNARPPRVTKSAFCDALLGKEVDFHSSTLLNVRIGAFEPEPFEPVKVVSNEQKLHDEKRDVMMVVYMDMFNYLKKFPPIDALKQYAQQLTELTKHYVKSLDEIKPTLLGELLGKNRKALKDAWLNGKLTINAEENK